LKRYINEGKEVDAKELKVAWWDATKISR